MNFRNSEEETMKRKPDDAIWDRKTQSEAEKRFLERKKDFQDGKTIL